MNIRVPAKTFTGTGAATGYINVTANDGAYPGAIVWIHKSDATLKRKAVITDLNGADKMGLKFINDAGDSTDTTSKAPRFGRDDLSAYGAGSVVNMAAQVVEVDQPIADPKPTIYM